MVKMSQVAKLLYITNQSTSILIGCPWKMVVMWINLAIQCLLVVQDYFVEWEDAIPLSDQQQQELQGTGEIMLKSRDSGIL